MANDDFFDALDAAEARQGQKIFEEKQEKKVRYWYEEGYVPGNEKDSDDEIQPGEGGGDDIPLDVAHVDDDVVSNADSDASSTVYEEIKIEFAAKHGGRRVKWGGLEGRLALSDAAPSDAAPDAPVTTLAIASFQDVMDELLLLGDEPAPPPRNDPRLDEVTSVVVDQTVGRRPGWSYAANSQLALEDGVPEEEFAATKARFAIEDETENAQLRSEESPAMVQWAQEQQMLKKQARQEFISEFRKEEAKKRSIERGAREQLPGTRKPLPLSQAWQEAKAETGGKKEGPKPTGRSMLPCNFSRSSSSQDGAPGGLQLEGRSGQSGAWSLRRAPGQELKQEKVLRPPPSGDALDHGITPQFRVPARPTPKYLAKRLAEQAMRS